MHTTLLSCLFLAFFTVVASCPNLSTKSFRVQNYDFSTEIQREWGEIRCLVFLANSFIVTCQAAHLYNIFHTPCKDLRNSMQAHHSLLSPLLAPILHGKPRHHTGIQRTTNFLVFPSKFIFRLIRSHSQKPNFA